MRRAGSCRRQIHAIMTGAGVSLLLVAGLFVRSGLAQIGAQGHPLRPRVGAPGEAQQSGTARDYYTAAAPVAEGWRSDVGLAGASGVADSLWRDGESDVWVFMFESPTVPESIFIVSVVGGFVFGQAYGDSVAQGIVDPRWIDSDQAAAVAESNGGATLRSQYAVSSVFAGLSHGVWRQDRSIWYIEYALQDTFVEDGVFFIDAVTGDFLGHDPVGIGGGPEGSRSPLPRAGLGPNYPNPFNPSTTIPFAIPGEPGGTAERVVLAIYDLRGRLVRSLLEEALSPGRYAIVWDGRAETGSQAPSSIYVARLEVGGRVLNRKLAFVK